MILTSPIHNNLPRSSNDIYSLHFAGSNVNNQNSSQSRLSLFGDDGFTFGDLIDIVNPLQHIPIINKIYQKMTGDTIAPLMQIAGGALFGGPIGAVTSLITAAIDEYATENHSKPDVNGVDPATVAGTYPFSEPNSNSETDQKDVNTETISSSYPFQNPHAITMGMRYGDGIYNPATTNYDQQALAQLRINKSAGLYASADPAPIRTGALSSSWFVNTTYNNSVARPVDNTQARVDIIIGAQTEPG